MAHMTPPAGRIFGLLERPRSGAVVKTWGGMGAGLALNLGVTLRWPRRSAGLGLDRLEFLVHAGQHCIDRRMPLMMPLMQRGVLGNLLLQTDVGEQRTLIDRLAWLRHQRVRGGSEQISPTRPLGPGFSTAVQSRVAK